jgi:hypothetical protein
LLRSNQLLLTVVVVVTCIAGLTLRAHRAAEKPATDGYVGSSSCRSCHEEFYQLWSTSHHGLAMQPFSAETARRAGFQNGPEIRIGNSTYRADLTVPPAGRGARSRSASALD